MPGYSVETLRQLAATGDEYYRGVLADHRRFGSLTLSQVKSLQERRLDDVDLNPHQYTSAPAPQVIEASKLEQAIAHARSKGVTQPIIRVAGFTFMPADPARARPDNKDAIFVTTKERNGTYLGKVKRSKFMPSRDCGSHLEKILDALADPLKAAIQYGLATGQCSICNRVLTNPESIKVGIGPVCRARFGW